MVAPEALPAGGGAAPAGPLAPFWDFFVFLGGGSVILHWPFYSFCKNLEPFPKNHVFFLKSPSDLAKSPGDLAKSPSDLGNIKPLGAISVPFFIFHIPIDQTILYQSLFGGIIPCAK